MADLEICTLDVMKTAVDSSSTTELEVHPLKTFQHIGDFLFCLSKTQLPLWMQTVKKLVDIKNVCLDNGEDCVRNVWSPRKQILTKSVPKTLVCHDFKGGYLDDRFVNGTSDNTNYVFRYWSYVDIFVYFSHHFITIPPPTWIDASHLHGVPILGTLITEWVDGENIWRSILESPQKITWFADALSRIAKLHHFDGYLLNIENKLEETQISLIVNFIQTLKRFLNLHLGENNFVIWYDSVTIDGDLKWQNELNEKNEIFFDNCDGIFLNYTWNEDCLRRSVCKAGERLFDVYVGVDVFGRNFYGGGGFNTDKALEVIKKYNLSCAIFAFGWTFEVLEGNFLINDDIFWSKISSYLRAKPIGCLPFYTNFSIGSGFHYYEHGCRISNSWFNLSKQSYQLSLLCGYDIRVSSRITETLEEIKSKCAEVEKLVESAQISKMKSDIDILKSRLANYYGYATQGLEHYLRDGYSGGCCLNVNPSVFFNNDTNRFKHVCLFLFDVVTRGELRVELVTKCVLQVPVVCYVSFLNRQGHYKVKYLLDKSDSNGVMASVHKMVLCSDCNEVSGWIRRRYHISGCSRLLEIGLYVEPTMNPFYVGEIRIEEN